MRELNNDNDNINNDYVTRHKKPYEKPYHTEGLIIRMTTRERTTISALTERPSAHNEIQIKRTMRGSTLLRSQKRT